jgi:ligand-binding sensor domain-containing protein
MTLGTLAAALAPAGAQHLEAESPGLHSVRVLLPEPDVLWAATDAGLLRWDLTRQPPALERINPRRSGLPSFRTSAVARGPDGALWVGTRDRGLACLKGQAWSLYTVENTQGGSGLALASNGIRGLLINPPRDELWILHTPKSLDLVRSPRCGGPLAPLLRRSLPLPQMAEATIEDLAADAQGTVWIGASSASGPLLFRDSGTGIQVVNAPGLPPDPAVFVTSVAVDGQDRPWLGTSAGAYRLGGANLFVHYGQAQGLPEEDLADLTADSAGTLWALTRTLGPASFNGSVFEPRPVPVASGAFSAAAANRALDAGVWFGTLDQGATGLSLDGTPLRSVDAGSTPPCADVTAAIVDLSSGDLWVGCAAEGLSRFDGSTWTSFNQQNTPQILSNAITSAALEPPDTLWFATDGGGALRVQGLSFTAFGPAQGVPLDLTSVAVGPGEEKWFGSRTQGACRLDPAGGPCQPFRAASGGLLSDEVRGIAVLPDGQTWLSTPVGLSLYTGTGFSNVNAGTHPPGDFEQAPFPGDLTQVRASADGTLLCAGTGGSGAVCLEGPTGSPTARWRSLTTDNGLPSDQVLSLGIDSSSLLWIGTSRGLVQASEGVVLDRIDAEDGLPSEAIVAVEPERAPQRLGILRLGTRGGGLVTLEATMRHSVPLRPLDEQQTLRGRAPPTAEVSCSSVRLRWQPFLGPGFAAYEIRRREVGPLAPVSAPPGLPVAAAAVLLGLAALRIERRWRRAAAALLLAAAPLLPGLGPDVARGGSGFTLIGTVTQRSVTVLNDTTVQNDRLYRYRIDVSLADASRVTGLEMDVPVRGLVSVPPDLGFSELGPNSVKLSWAAPATNTGCPATALQVYRIPAMGPPQPILGLQPATAGSIRDNSLQPLQRYRYALAAVNGFGESDLSPIVDITTPATQNGPRQCRPPAPRRLQVRAIGKDRIELRFVERGPLPSCPTLGFNVYQVEGQIETSKVKVGAGQSRAVVSGLMPDTQYTFRVRAIGRDGESDPSPTRSTRTRPESSTVGVPGARAMVSAGLSLASGERVGIHWRRGAIRFTQVVRDRGELVNAFGLPRPDFTAESWPEDTSVSSPDPVPALGAGHAGLLVWFGSQPVFIGEGGCFTAPVAGALALGPNDGTPVRPNGYMFDVGNSEDFVVEVFLDC